MDVKKFNLFGEEINIKDEKARNDIANIKIPYNYGNHVRWYIDCVNGNDDNDGTISSPWKTLDKFFSMCNSVTTDIRCYIVAAGTYNFSNPVFQGVTVHISANVPNVTIYGNLSEPWAFYNCHINFQGTSSGNININCSNYIYGDNCLWTLKYCTFTPQLRVYGGYINAENCTFSSLRIGGACGNIDTTTYTSTDATTYNLRVENSAFVISTGSTYYAGKNGVTNDSGCFISVESSMIIIRHACNRQGNNPAKWGIKNSNGIVIINQSRLNSFSTNSSNGNSDNDSFYFIQDVGIQYKNALRYNSGNIEYYNGSNWVAT